MSDDSRSYGLYPRVSLNPELIQYGSGPFVQPQAPTQNYGKELPPVPNVQRHSAPAPRVTSSPAVYAPPAPTFRRYTLKTVTRTQKTLRLSVEEQNLCHMYATIFDDHISLQDTRHQQFGTIQKTGINLKQSYTVHCRGSELAKATRQLKFSKDKKIVYEIDPQKIIKLRDNGKKVIISLNEENIGEMEGTNEINIAVTTSLDIVHIISSCLMMIDIKTN
jgi:hypothetical protein